MEGFELIKNLWWLVAAAATLGGAWAIVRHNTAHNGERLDDHNERILGLEKQGGLTHKEAENKFVTRREFDLHVKNLDLKIDHIRTQNDAILTTVKGKQ